MESTDFPDTHFLQHTIDAAAQNGLRNIKRKWNENEDVLYRKVQFTFSFARLWNANENGMRYRQCRKVNMGPEKLVDSNLIETYALKTQTLIVCAVSWVNCGRKRGQVKTTL